VRKKQKGLFPSQLNNKKEDRRIALYLINKVLVSRYCNSSDLSVLAITHGLRNKHSFIVVSYNE